MELRELILRTRAEGVEAAQRKFTHLTNSVGGGLDRMRSKTAALSGAFAGLFSLWTAKEAFSGLIQTNRSMEKLYLALKTTTGGVAQANKEWARLEKFAATTPYALSQSVDAFIKLKNFGLDATEEAMRSYGDTSSAMGKDLMQFIEAVADAVTGENERLKEFGIKASQAGDSVSYTFRGVTTTVKKSAEEIQRYLIGLGQQNFFGAMADQMSGIGGKLSNLEDSFDRLKYAIGRGGFSDAVGEAASKMSAFFDEIVTSGKAEQIGRAFGRGLQFATDKATILIDRLMDLAQVDFDQARKQGGVLWLFDQLAAGAQIVTHRISRFIGQLDSLAKGEWDEFTSKELDNSFYDEVARVVKDRPDMLKQYAAKYPVEMQAALARLDRDEARKTDLRSWISGIRNKEEKSSAAREPVLLGDDTAPSGNGSLAPNKAAIEAQARAIEEANEALEVYQEYMKDLFGEKEEIGYKSRLLSAAEDDRRAIELEWEFLREWDQIQEAYEKAYKTPGMTKEQKDSMAAAVADLFQFRRGLYEKELAKEKEDRYAREFDQYWQDLSADAGHIQDQFNPRSSYQKQVSRLGEMSQAGLISQETEARAVEEATRQLEETERSHWLQHGTWIDGAKIALADYRDEITKTSQHVYDAFSRSLQATEDLFVQFAQTGKFSFSSLVQSIQADMVRVAYRNTIGNLLTSAFSSLFAGFGQTPAEQLRGQVWGGARALGGPVYAGSTYLVGERGPELFSPKQSGTIIPNGGNNNITIQQYFSGSPSKQTAKQAAREAADFVGRKLSRL